MDALKDDGYTRLCRTTRTPSVPVFAHRFPGLPRYARGQRALNALLDFPASSLDPGSLIFHNARYTVLMGLRSVVLNNASAGLGAGPRLARLSLVGSVET